MKDIKWSLLKNERLKKTRGASFEEIIESNLIGVKKHPKRLDQKIMLFEYHGYIWVVPFVRRENEIFLKKYIRTEGIQSCLNEVNYDQKSQIDQTGKEN